MGEIVELYMEKSLSPNNINTTFCNTKKELILKSKMFWLYITNLWNVYSWTNGVAMGSPLGPSFSKYYMEPLENKTNSSR